MPSVSADVFTQLRDLINSGLEAHGGSSYENRSGKEKECPIPPASGRADGRASTKTLCVRFPFRNFL